MNADACAARKSVWRAGSRRLLRIVSALLMSAALLHVAPSSIAEERGETEHRLTWSYPRFRGWQYAASVAVSVVGLYLEFGIDGDYRDSAWNSGILFDDAARSALAASSKQGRRRAEVLSDFFWHGPQWYPVVIDGLLVPLATDRWNTDVALQMSLLNWQALSLAGVLTRLTHHGVGRARPSLDECEEDPSYDEVCETDAVGRTASFISGHTAMAMTGAGLVCAHHQALPLYGGNAADVVVCGVAVAAGLTNGVMRVVADAHWASDVLAGVALGFGIGYGVPYLLHYGQAGPEPLGSGFLPKNTAIAPLVSDQVIGLAFTGSM